MFMAEPITLTVVARHGDTTLEGVPFAVDGVWHADYVVGGTPKTVEAGDYDVTVQQIVTHNGNFYWFDKWEESDATSFTDTVTIVAESVTVTALFNADASSSSGWRKFYGKKDFVAGRERVVTR